MATPNLRKMHGRKDSAYNMSLIERISSAKTLKIPFLSDELNVDIRDLSHSYDNSFFVKSCNMILNFYFFFSIYSNGTWILNMIKSHISEHVKALSWYSPEQYSSISIFGSDYGLV